jgi:hypothetical protein
MFDQVFFRRVVRISAVLCCIITALTVALRFSSAGASCPALDGAPIYILLAVALAWLALFWRRTHDQIVSTKTRLDNMGLQNPIMEAINYNVLLIFVMAFFIGASAWPLLLYIAQCT